MLNQPYDDRSVIIFGNKFLGSCFLHDSPCEGPVYKLDYAKFLKLPLRLREVKCK